MATVYIETTIPSFYYSTRKSVQALAWREQTRVWWDTYRAHFDLFTSESVIDELRAAPRSRGLARLELIADVPLLPLKPEIPRIAAEYIRQRVMPAVPDLDAMHVAFASFYEIGFVLAWNCRHIANVNKVRHLTEVNQRLGLRTPMMVTPYTLLPEGPTDEENTANPG